MRCRLVDRVVAASGLARDNLNLGTTRSSARNSLLGIRRGGSVVDDALVRGTSALRVLALSLEVRRLESVLRVHLGDGTDHETLSRLASAFARKFALDVRVATNVLESTLGLCRPPDADAIRRAKQETKPEFPALRED